MDQMNKKEMKSFEYPSRFWGSRTFLSLRFDASPSAASPPGPSRAKTIDHVLVGFYLILYSTSTGYARPNQLDELDRTSMSGKITKQNDTNDVIFSKLPL